MLWYPWLKFYFPSMGDMAVYYNDFNGMADSCGGSLDLYLIFRFRFSPPTSCALAFPLCILVLYGLIPSSGEKAV